MNRLLLKNMCLIDGQWQHALDGGVIDVLNPATQEHLCSVPNMGNKETDLAIDAAHNAWLSWRETSASKRAELLKKWHVLIEQNKETLARIMTQEQGKPLAESIGEMNYANSFIEWFAEEARRVYGDTIAAPRTDQRIWVMKQSIGVCALITPWNFPAAMITRKAAPALAAGCTVVIKPASQTPLTALALVALAEQAGFPKGVINIVTGKASEIGEALTHSPRVKKISFTGSTQIGRLLMAQSAQNVMKVSMELGGNAPFIVFSDADIDAAITGLVAAKSRNTGQTCISANRVFVHGDIYDAFATRYAEVVANMSVGNGLDESVVQGPLIDMAGLEKVEQLVKDALSKGASLLTGGQRHELGGSYYQPTVLTHVPDDALLHHEEIFGPVTPLISFDNEAEVTQKANNTPYGLAAYFYTNDLNRAYRVSEALESGMVGINTGAISTTVAPFGGVKQSGVGREGSHQGIDEYLETKYICLGNVT